MTKEPIMINDVDVSGCEFYINSKNLEFNCKQTPQSYFCKNQPNCYYKQLKRKEEECEELRDELEWVHGIKDQLKVENEEFKKTVLKKCPQCGEEYLTPKGAELYDENNLLKQTLQEIKDYCNNYPQNSIGFKQQILQKCKEVLKDETRN